MMADITITTSSKTVTVTAPYEPSWPKRARQLDGDFKGKTNDTRGVWVFDIRDEQRVRELAREIYGTDGSDEGATNTVTVRINMDTIDLSRQRGGEKLFLFGREIVSRRQRDWDVRLGIGVIVVTGGFPGRGGSVANPRLDAQEDTVLEVRDVPATHADIAAYGATVVETTVDRDALRAERDRLIGRLAEIDALLGGA